MGQRTKSFGPETYQVSYTITQENHGKRLDQFLKNHFESFSRERIKKKIKAGDISISQRSHSLKSSTRVNLRDIVTIITRKDDFKKETWNGEEILLEEELQIIEETKDYVVLNKPPFMATHPTGKHLFYCATVYLEHLTNSKIDYSRR